MNRPLMSRAPHAALSLAVLVSLLAPRPGPVAAGTPGGELARSASLAGASPAAESAPLLPARVRERLARAAMDSSLALWQRELMRGLATDPAGPRSQRGAADGRPAQPEAAQGAADGWWAELVIDSRCGHGAVYDPVRDRLIVFGGIDSSGYRLADVWALWLTPSPRWAQMSPSGSPPEARSFATAIYDSADDRVIVFGGAVTNGSYRNDVWALSLAGSPAWSQLAPSGTPPVARYEHSAIYDPVRQRMVVFGGIDGTYTPRNDVWALSLAGSPAWSQLAPAGTPPEARAGHTAIYDPLRDRMLVMGGYGSSNTVWALALASPAWSTLSAGGYAPGGQPGHTAIYDAAADRMVIYGDVDGTQSVYALTLAGSPTWSWLSVAGAVAPARIEHSAIYDPRRSRMLVFGGEDYGGGTLNDVWGLALTGPVAWTELTPSGPLPPGSDLKAGIYDPVRDRMVVVGGLSPSGSGGMAAPAAVSLAGAPVWSTFSPSGTAPIARSGHTAVYDPVRDRILVFGGESFSYTYLNDVWAITLAGTPTWTPLAPSGTPPTARWYHTAIYDPVRDRMLVFGGRSSTGVLYDAWALSLGASPAWSLLSTTGGPPPAAYQQSAIYDPIRDRMVVFGGYNGGYSNATWALSLGGSPAWTQLAPTGPLPAARSVHSAIYDGVRDRMVIYGGAGAPNGADVWALSFAGTPAWSALAPTGAAPALRNSHVAIYDPKRDRMVLCGGDNAMNDSWQLVWGELAGVGGPRVPPAACELLPPVPNPARGGTRLSFTLESPGRVRLEICDLAGRHVRTLLDVIRPAGASSATWDGRGAAGERLPAGVYLVRLVAPGATAARRIVLLD